MVSRYIFLHFYCQNNTMLFWYCGMSSTKWIWPWIFEKSTRTATINAAPLFNVGLLNHISQILIKTAINCETYFVKLWPNIVVRFKCTKIIALANFVVYVYSKYISLYFFNVYETIGFSEWFIKINLWFIKTERIDVPVMMAGREDEWRVIVLR